jgi:glycosyltransferase involved in cell wall biosynthesis
MANAPNTVGAQVFVAPPFDGPPTGGTLYNAALVAALSRAGVPCTRVSIDEATRLFDSHEPARVWVDSLYMDALPELAEHNVERHPLGLIVHYLPSLVDRGEVSTGEDLSSSERAALSTARFFLATSGYMRDVLERAGADATRIAVVEPGVEVGLGLSRTRASGSDLRALVIANLVPGKGVLPFLEALLPVLSGGVPLSLSIVGSLDQKPAYAAACRERVDRAALGSRVQFLGPLSRAELARELEACDVLVSASRMESFGMALAEGRAAGLPILALDGGNVRAHVERGAGGALFDDDRSLVRALVHLARDPDEVERRARLARAAARRRAWDDAAAELVEWCGARSGDGV